jgi:hypothetical protein
MSETKKNTRRWWRYVLYIVLGICVLGTVFGVGFFVGRWRGYASASGTPALPRPLQPSSGHGAIGKITRIEGTTLTLQAHDGTIQTILVENRTRIERGTVKPTRLTLRDLQVGDRVIVVGKPNAQGQIKANVIRVLLAPTLTPTPTGL